MSEPSEETSEHESSIVNVEHRIKVETASVCNKGHFFWPMAFCQVFTSLYDPIQQSEVLSKRVLFLIFYSIIVGLHNWFQSFLVN